MKSYISRKLPLATRTTERILALRSCGVSMVSFPSLARFLVVPEGNSPGQSKAHFDIVVAGLHGVADARVEGEGVADLPDRSRQRGVGRVVSASLVLGVDLGHRPDGPVVRAFQDEADESVRVMVARQRRRGVEVQAERVPPVGGDEVRLRAETVRAADLRQERTGLERDADAALALQRAAAQDTLQEDVGIEQPDPRLAGHSLQRDEVLEVDHQLESWRDAEVEHGGRGHEVVALWAGEELRRAHLELELADLGNVAVRPVEGAVGEGG